MNNIIINNQQSFPFQREFWIDDGGKSSIIEELHSESFYKRRDRKNKYNKLFK
jgi:hypothetical protein